MYIARCAFGLFAAAISFATAEEAPQRQDLYESIEFFEKNIRPILAERCFECHGAEKHKSGLRLDSRAAALIGGEHGPALAPGDVGASRMAEAIRRTGEL